MSFKDSEASKVPFLKITGPKLIFQIDKQLYTEINKYGCRFMSMIAIPQIVTGKRLTTDDIKYIYDQAVAGNLGEDVMGRDCTCGSNEHKLMNMAFDLLKDKDHYCRQIFVSDAAGKYKSPDMLPSKENLLFIVVDFNTNSDKRTYGGHHFVLFNSIGELIYDPAGGTVKSWKSLNRWLVYKVYSKSEQDKAASPSPPPAQPKATPVSASKPENTMSNSADIENSVAKPAPKTTSKPQNTIDNSHFNKPVTSKKSPSNKQLTDYYTWKDGLRQIERYRAQGYEDFTINTLTPDSYIQVVTPLIQKFELEFPDWSY